MLQMFFATCMLHVHLMHWEDESSVERAVAKCDEVWDFLDPQKVSVCITVILSVCVCVSPVIYQCLILFLLSYADAETTMPWLILLQ